MIFPRKDPRALAEARVGSTLNSKWHIDRLLDVGGMGAVFAATHRNGKRVALKVLHKQFASDAEIRKRFLREGYVANKIGHPGALSIIDDDTSEDGAPFLVMELLEGESLSQRLERLGGRLPMIDVIAIAGQVLDVLSAAHDQSIVHRDIKPGNIFITYAGHTKLLDFGLARIHDAAASMVATGMWVVLGTSGYMPPEQARGRTDLIDARSDIFAVGAVIFRALTGRYIHANDIESARFVKGMTAAVPSLGSVQPELPRILVDVVDKALAFEMNDRWQSAREMFEALRAVFVYATQPPRSMAPLGSAHRPSPDTPAVADASHPLVESSSLVVDVAFGHAHETLLAEERARTREVIEGLSALSVVVDEIDLRAPTTKRMF